MGFLFTIVGAFAGGWIMAGKEAIFGVAAGALLGWVLQRLLAAQTTIRSLATRIELLEQRNIAAAKSAAGAQEPAAAKTEIAPAIEKDTSALAAKAVFPSEPVTTERVDAGDSENVQIAGRADRSKIVTIDERFFAAARRWLTTGNVPVKVGVVISFFGVAFLLKYAVENQVFAIPVSFRYAGVAAFAGVLLAIGWRKRASSRVFALSLQGGGIGVLYLTVFAAFRLHALLSPAVAFVLLILITAAAGYLAVRQESRALAILGTTGGFLAPLLVSTGGGNHVGLFTYYLILNGVVLSVAWFRAWRELNIIGFVFTFGVGTIWGYQYYVPELFATTEPFLVLYFLFYTAIAVLFAFRQPPKLRGYVDATLVFGTPTLAFALQSRLLDGNDNALAASALVLAGFYGALALWLRRSQSGRFNLLSQAFIALAVAFFTLAVPLSMDDRWTAISWALEGAALTWIGVRQAATLAKAAGTILAFLGGGMFLEHGWIDDLGIPVLNTNFLGAAIVSIAALASARRLETDDRKRDWQNGASLLLLLWGLGWWFCGGGAEIFDRVADRSQLHVLLLFVTGSFATIAYFGRRLDWNAYRRAALALLPGLPLFAFAYLIEFEHFLSGLGLLGWTLAFAAHLWILWCASARDSRILRYLHGFGAVFFVGLIALEAGWQVDQLQSNEVWSAGAALLVVALATFGLFRSVSTERWPFDDYAGAYQTSVTVLTSIYFTALFALCVANPGDPAPLPYIPLLNPLGVLSAGGLAVLWAVLGIGRRIGQTSAGDRAVEPHYLFAVVAFFLSTIAVVRAVHHITEVPWHMSELMSSVGVQSTLSIYWAILGLGGMVLGARREAREIWMAGALLMVVVVLKLFVVDLGNTGTVARIVSFLGVGVMLLVVGYFSPVPPKRERASVE